MATKSGRPPRSKADILLVQTKIASTALRLFREEGFDAVSIRRLAKEAGCAPMTIYAHFENKADILQHLWADVLSGLFGEISKNLENEDVPADRLRIAAQTFVAYWLAHPDHFRLVFMSSGLSRADVDTFMRDDKTLEYFSFFTRLVQASLTNSAPTNVEIKAKSDSLIAGMVGIALCINTIADYSWTTAQEMTNTLVAGLTR